MGSRKLCWTELKKERWKIWRAKSCMKQLVNVVEARMVCKDIVTEGYKEQSWYKQDVTIFVFYYVFPFNFICCFSVICINANMRRVHICMQSTHLMDGKQQMKLVTNLQQFRTTGETVLTAAICLIAHYF